MDFLNYQVFVQMFKKAVRQAENAGDMPPPARGVPDLREGGGHRNFSLPYSFLYIPDYLRIP